MKKYIISSVVVIGFIGYSFYQRVYGAEDSVALKPKTITTLPTATPTPTSALSNVPSDTPVLTKVPNSIQPRVTSTPIPTATPVPTAVPKAAFKDGTYVGDAADAFYGLIQVQATISNGKITDITFLQHPSDRSTSIEINSQADPMLAQEAIAAQSANVNIISGATDSSQAFIQSLQSALVKAKS